MSSQHDLVSVDHTVRVLYAREQALNSAVINFHVPLHVMAETGGLSIQIRESPIHGDIADETHSAWPVDLIGGIRQDMQTGLVHSSKMGRLPRGIRTPLRPSADRWAPKRRRSQSGLLICRVWVLAGTQAQPHRAPASYFNPIWTKSRLGPPADKIDDEKLRPSP